MRPLQQEAWPLVAVDANPATRKVVTGTEAYTRALLPRLAESGPRLRWVFYASRPAPGLGADLTVLPFGRLWSQGRLAAELLRRRPALFFAPAHVVPFACPVPALAVVHDLAFERYPAAYPAAQLAYLRLSTRWAALRCRRLVAVSEATRADLVELYSVRPEKVVVVPSGVAPPPRAPGHRALRELGLRPPFVLQVGRVEPRKNQLTSLAAVERVAGLQLVVAGPVADQEMASRLRASPRCVLLGPVDDAIRDALYAGASALVFPSLYEGFGFPVLEAMSRGLPVVTSRNSSLPEVGGEAALYVDDPLDAEGLADQLRRILEDESLRTRLRRAGRARARLFSWDRCAQRLVEVIESLVS